MVKGLPNLISLGITSSNINDDNLKSIVTSNTKLKQLNLENNKITSEGLKCLVVLEGVEALNVRLNPLIKHAGTSFIG